MKRFLVFILLAAGSAQAAVTLMPANPSANRLFSIRANSSECGPYLNQRAIVAGSVITVAFETSGACFSPQPPGATDIAVTTSVPAGTYEIRLRSERNGVVLATTVGLSQLVVTGNDFTGLWYDPAAPGWGLHVAQGESGAIFATWFVYNPSLATGQIDGLTLGTWYVAPSAQLTSPTQVAGALYVARGGGNITAVGTLNLTLVADGQLRLGIISNLHNPVFADLRRLEF